MTDPEQLWPIRPGVTYLNHGSWGPTPWFVQRERQRWSERLASEPMDFFLREHETALDGARARLAKFIGAKPHNLAFVDNATFGMNVVAANVRVGAGDEILATDHEYGAVLRLWRQTCQQTGATVRIARLPEQFTTAEALLDTLFAQVTPQTKLLVVSHIASPTAVLFPVAAICQRAAKQGLSVCIDGAHAPAAVDIQLEKLNCDYYVASCHKWLSAPLGSGFLYVHPRRQRAVEPRVVSWGNSLGGRPSNWVDEFHWAGTRDPASFLAVGAAVEFLENAGVERFRQHSRDLIRYARQQISSWTGLEPTVPEEGWTGTMIALPLPAAVGPPLEVHSHQLQQQLWHEHQIEVPIVNWHDKRWLRVSAHLYNDSGDIDRLLLALKKTVGV